MKIVTMAEVPDELGNAWCHHVQDFTVTHPGCKFNFFAVDPNKTIEEIAKTLGIKDPLTKS